MNQRRARRTFPVVSERKPTPEEAQAIIAQAAGPLARVLDAAQAIARRRYASGASDGEVCAEVDALFGVEQE